MTTASVGVFCLIHCSVWVQSLNGDRENVVAPLARLTAESAGLWSQKTVLEAVHCNGLGIQNVPAGMAIIAITATEKTTFISFLVVYVGFFLAKGVVLGLTRANISSANPIPASRP